MASMFGAPWNLGQVVQGSPVPLSLGPSSGFPGVFPTAGPANSGWGGWFGPVGPCTNDDVKTGRCVMGPRMELMGNR